MAVDPVEAAVMFTDIVGFTEYTAIEGDARAVEMLSVQERVVQDVLPPGARIVKELGDGLLLLFPEPCAAVVCALTLQRRFEAQWFEHMLPLWVRMGMHWGRPTRRNADIVGHDVNLASRIVNVAGSGELVVSGATVDEVRRRDANTAHFDEIGPVMLKGIPEPVRLFRALPA
jgi:class 3 adenylate cyclase